MKLEQQGPTGKERENEEEHEEQTMNIPEPPEPKGVRTDPSVQMVRSDGGREDKWRRAGKEWTGEGSVRRQGDTRERHKETAGKLQGPKGGQTIRLLSRGRGRG